MPVHLSCKKRFRANNYMHLQSLQAVNTAAHLTRKNYFPAVAGFPEAQTVSSCAKLHPTPFPTLKKFLGFTEMVRKKTLDRLEYNKTRRTKWPYPTQPHTLCGTSQE
jgi:hypothetical protein